MGAVLSQLRSIARLTATVGALLMALPATAGAELRWQPVQEIADGPNFGLNSADVAVDARGDALAMWLERPAGALVAHYSWRTRTAPGASRGRCHSRGQARARHFRSLRAAAQPWPTGSPMAASGSLPAGPGKR